MIKKNTFFALSLLLLGYMFIPGPKDVYQLADLPSSVRSNLDGDTWQVPNLKAYFTNSFRPEVIPFYVKNYAGLTMLPFGPLRLNYPPELAVTYIKVETHSTYLEEYVYPLRNSLYINGLEPYDESNNPKYDGAVKFDLPEGTFDNKVTLRYYPSAAWVRLVVWAGIVSCAWLLGKMSKKAFV
ncbi:hypothetical protein A2631_02720 [Candidatus Daviesbacteria bacterium RIFCSPHIGHO2_01_FULL_44_29]|uniref:Uncharacterized protein n=1 Tax=Candidatus Daviesbacteria bacterium RIFCSPHIGHO2_02_FULL_43_12 TaxID=1797776 RepID=A0A1F5KK47_9BACT|nr:MAG: hypothetical protein A2631_02720 [Candidatus Daviesbacteria bacterium RIFCSPHIGHO2_01_FULL_44_29]OGE40846.1 MAG: hypothetical protein A3E86_02630 [Candidatus Daviesbacteria bacterium RIFCSPHIGHO2_12_FULL_47_45]OGE41298.1 MAG: hypothetical protein A3D25_02115 [Candidatus Daviesbacteria bacterium RIFCSPHIGHO2_02_FULL_43_12]OGE69499.1 MAG: hypothetical protein A3B55_03855 [Candidatus Daviesbacteria bacterium RIFCSPLOWO2_01_FULL_43_15]